jgi:glycosyltransferase involved in cell wall biosynthesis
MTERLGINDRPKLLLLITEDWYFWSHRRPIAAAAKAAGFEVLIASRFHHHEEAIRRAGFRPVPISLRRSGRNPFRELMAILDLVRIYRREKPAIVHHVAIKPVLYGSWAAAIAGVPAVVNALAGLGHVFIARGRKASLFRRLAKLAYRSALRGRGTRLIFQNPEDRRAFVRNRIVEESKTVLIRGAGVSLDEFKEESEPREIPTVMLAGRLLWNKGAGDLVEASRLLRQRGVECRIALVGEPDNENPRAIPESTLRQWEQEGVIEWWGKRENMPSVLAQSNLVVLPTTYGEGVPKVLIEAAAVGRAIVATDVVGCREIVRHEENGVLVPPNDPLALANAIERLLREPFTRARMGRRGREIVAAEFSEEQVVRETMELYRSLLGAGSREGERTRAAA